MRTAVIALFFSTFLSVLSSQGQDDKEPTWQETADFVTRTLEHYGGYSGYFMCRISNATVNAKNLSYQLICLDSRGSIVTEFTHSISFPLDKLDVSSIKTSKSEDVDSKQPVFHVKFFCLEGKCVQDTHSRRVRIGDHWSESETLNEFESAGFVINSTDEDQMNRLARALKHLAILAGSPSKELLPTNARKSRLD
jgi:hypothetical protein